MTAHLAYTLMLVQLISTAANDKSLVLHSVLFWPTRASTVMVRNYAHLTNHR